MPSPPRWALVASSGLLAAAQAFAQPVFINEIHYDNDGGDVGEFVEVAGPSGTVLGGYSLVFYNGNGSQSYDSEPLVGTIPNEAGSGFGAISFPVSQIQNGGPDGLALVDDGGVVLQFLSYEGTMTAIGGAADGMTSVDIGVSESASTDVGLSLQLKGTGANYAEFSWATPSAESPGAINAGQTFTGSGLPTISLSASPDRFFEGEGASASLGTVTLSPAPTEVTVVDLSADIVGQITVPETVSVGTSGSASFPIGVVADGVSDGDQLVTISASVAGGEYAMGQVAVTVLDVDPPVGRGVALRVATYNVRNGVGAPGSSEYEAVLAVVRRVCPDVIAFTEADSTGDFANLKALLADLGMGTDPVHFAAKGEGFEAVSFSAGDFGAGQSIAVASRWPITRAVQIGRGVAGRVEMTRFPLFVEVDVPGIDDDPAFVAVHFKAGDFDTDSFRRAVEAHRVAQFLTAEGYNGTADNVFVIGDLNEDSSDRLPESYFTGIDTATQVFGDGSMLPASYVLGADLAPPGGIFLDYEDFPDEGFEPLDFKSFDSLQPDGARRTFNAHGDSRIDYLLAGEFTVGHARPVTEVYNSLLDDGFGGLPKVGQRPAAAASFIASDHHLLFGDFVLAPAPAIDIYYSTRSVRVSISPPPLADVEVKFSTSFEGMGVPQSVLVPAGGGDVYVPYLPFSTARKNRFSPSGWARLTASAPGHVSDHFYFILTSREPSGRVLFSQYIESPAGGSPRAVEVVNAGGASIDFTEDALRLSIGKDGGEFDTALVLLQGEVAAGGVLVVGGVETGEYLIAEGLLAEPALPLADYEDGSVFLDGAGRAVFVKMTLSFNGDDALQLTLDFILADTFGVAGFDPGDSWLGGGVSTANQNLALRDDVGTGSGGWHDPSLRWVTVGPGDDLSGFGIAPPLADPYLVWAGGFGLGGIDAAPSSDLEPDGLTGLGEFAFGGSPIEPDSWKAVAAVSVGGEAGARYADVEFPRLETPGRVRYMIERSPGGRAWVPVSATEIGTTAIGGGYVRARWRVPLGAGDDSLLFRVRADLP